MLTVAPRASAAPVLTVSVIATPMTDAERQDLARAVADLVLLALPQLAASTPTAPATCQEAQEAA